MDTVVIALGRLFFQFCFWTLGFGVGWVLLKIVTLGRYPRAGDFRRDVSDVWYVAMLGQLALAFMIAMAVKLTQG